MKFSQGYSFLILTVLFLAGCGNTEREKTKLIKTRTNLELYKEKYARAIAHYSSPKDSLKLTALFFILNNLHDQYFISSDGIYAYETEIFKTKTNSIKGLISKWDSIKRIYSSTNTKVKDETVIDDDYLITSIDEAFKTRKNPWVKGISFKNFCEYVLPYKIGNEKPSGVGLPLALETYLEKDSVKKLSDPFMAVNYVNTHLSNWYRGNLNYDFPVDIGYKLSKIIGTGTCYSQARMEMFETRALGLPVVRDFVVNWGNRSSGHDWNALIYENKSYPLDPTGPGIGYYKVAFKGTGRIPYKISKVFRSTFSIHDNIINTDKSEFVPPLFADKRTKDVTDEYVPVSNIYLTFPNSLQNKFAYLCIFNDQNWVPSYWGTVTGDKVFFNNMGRDIVYLPAVIRNYALEPLGDPFIVTIKGKVKQLKASTKLTQVIVVRRKYPEDATNNIVKGDKYEFFYWSSKWNSLGVQVAKGNSLIFTNVPTNALYLVRNLSEGKQERVFTYEADKQIWW